MASSEKATPPPSQQAKVGMGPREWRERARMLGSSPHAIAGALHDRGDDETLTEDEVRAALDQFSVREGLGE